MLTQQALKNQSEITNAFSRGLPIVFLDCEEWKNYARNPSKFIIGRDGFLRPKFISETSKKKISESLLKFHWKKRFGKD